ncbi:MAG TPA: alpha/beta hydrolase family protein [Candidatus Binatia bacterium]|nr:alpha/beta hydrolase family protein [Candidatus Binatia bacterium]
MQNLEAVEPEGERYTADLLLLHGLWAAPTLWRSIALGFAQRGWRCWLLDARASADAGEPAGPSEVADWCGRAADAAKSLAAPPIAIGHDAGGLVALALAERGLVRAAVAAAPLLAGSGGLVPALAGWAARLAGRDVPPPAPSDPRLGGLSASARGRLVEGLRPESGRLVASLRGRALAPGSPRVPALLIAQSDDPFVPAPLVAVTARGIEADDLVLPGSHWPMVDDRIDAWTTQVHRWIVRRVGQGLLILRGDEDLRDD